MTMRTPLLNLALGAVLSCTTLAAQDSQKTWTAGASITNATESLRQVTHATTGFALDFGYNGHIGKTTVPFRASLGIHGFPGKEYNGVKDGIGNYQLAGDLFIKSPWKDTQFITGLSLNQWVNKPENPKGTKFGFRVGVERMFTPSWSAQVMFQMTELGTDSHATTGLNPSWIQAGAKFHF